MRVLLDTNVLLDYLQSSRGRYDDANVIWQAAQNGSLRGYVAAISITTIFYVSRKSPGNLATAENHIKSILDLFVICNVNEKILRAALSQGFKDYEDAVQYMCAVQKRVDAIITNDAKDFVTVSDMKVYSSNEFASRLKAPKL